MAMGSTIPASLYTLPRLWDQLKADVQYDKRRSEVEAFNKGSTWLKRGISITPARQSPNLSELCLTAVDYIML